MADSIYIRTDERIEALKALEMVVESLPPIAEGVIGPDEDLLKPRVSMAAGLRDWLPERIAAYSTSRPWVN